MRFDDARALINAPAADSFDATRPTVLIVYALPNGNMIEQTFGCRLGAGMDWHFDIQHVGAQVRRLREVDPTRNYVLALVEADGKSWPRWCDARAADAGSGVRRMVERVVELLPRGELHIALLAHSGGGAFVTNFVNAGDAMPESIDRVAYLDAYYKFADDRTTAEHLARWLRADRHHVLHVVCYDDRNIEVNGKKVITSADGGTFRGTHRLLDELTRISGDAPTITEDAPVQYVTMTDGQVRMIFHANPKNLILHTRLVEWNGVLRAMTVDSDLPQTWATLNEGRNYERWIQPAPTTQASTPPATRPAPRPAPSSEPALTLDDASGRRLDLPPRAPEALAGSAFFRKIDGLAPVEREAAVLAEITSGNVPPFLRRLVTIHASMTGADGVAHTADYFVMPDYLAIGSHDDFVRVPMMPMTAQRIADALDCTLPTRKIVDGVYKAARIKLPPQPLTQMREATRTFVQHSALIDAQMRDEDLARGAFVAGIKKDVVITNRLAEQPNRVAIYGWHKTDGTPIQPPTIVHKSTYVDYSHGVRLVSRRAIVDGRPMDILDAMKDASLCGLFSDEGVVNVTRYPTELPPATTMPSTEPSSSPAGNEPGRASYPARMSSSVDGVA